THPCPFRAHSSRRHPHSPLTGRAHEHAPFEAQTPTSPHHRCALSRRAKEEVFVSRRIQIFDTTLRDGEQSPGIALQPDEKAEIAQQLERLGVDVVEAGFPGASPGDFEGVRAVSGAVRKPTVAALARSVREDLDAAALADARRSRIHIFLATSPIHMERKLGLQPAEVVAQARWAVAYAAERAD